MQILVVEDDTLLAEGLVRTLTRAGHAVEHTALGAQADRLLAERSFDLVVLDIGLPKLDGLGVLKAARQQKIQAPVLLLTARDRLSDKVAGLDLGADDYLTKPFAFDELLARVRALTRRQLTGPAGALRYDDLEMDRLRRVVRRAGRPVDLSPREFRLLEYFLLHPEQIITRTRLLEQVWDMSFDPETNVVEAHISNLRSKLEERDAPRIIQTVRGAGYALRTAD